MSLLPTLSPAQAEPLSHSIFSLAEIRPSASWRRAVTVKGHPLGLSSTFCRAQETAERDRAANAKLENIRAVAGRAANAWGVEALNAERREARHERARTFAKPAAPQHDPGPSEDDNSER